MTIPKIELNILCYFNISRYVRITFVYENGLEHFNIFRKRKETHVNYTPQREDKLNISVCRTKPTKLVVFELVEMLPILFY